MPDFYVDFLDCLFGFRAQAEYIASYGDLIHAFGLNGDAGFEHFMNWGYDEGRIVGTKRVEVDYTDDSLYGDSTDGIERNLGPNLLRIKAIVTVEGEEEGPAVIQGAQHLLHNVTWLKEWPFPDRKSRFVLIAAGIGTEQLRDMVELLDRIATRSAAARPI